ncbi:MAG: hypothetical protein WBA38_04100 [Gordonia sp. (in: high G+C Gram-positive bacteria)]|uniref:hypothetical protein n=1 Tax=Gordonia sp. (in: high G+C Gram-positive bacteria) TaxID=84139 RepID=UPI003C7860A4
MATRLGRPLTTDEAALVLALLDEASASVRAWMRCAPTDPVQPDVVLVVSRMVKRVIEDSDVSEFPAHLDQFSQNAGTYSRSGTFTEGSQSGSPWLTKDDKRILRSVCGGSARMAASFRTW